MKIPFLGARATRANDPLRPDDAKASRTAALIAFQTQGRPAWTPRDYAALAREGFARNAIVYRAVRMIAEAAASVPWLLYEGAAEVDAHPLLALLARPNRRQAGRDLLEALYGHLLVAGNAYVEAVVLDGAVRELHVLRPDRMKVVPGGDGWPEAYEYSVGGRTVRFPVSGEGIAPVLHLSLFHPLDDHYGFAPIEAAAVALDIHNAAGAWNKALLDNSARPSGALVYAAKEGGNLSAEQFERLKAELETGFTGAARAGRPLLLEGGLDWKAMGLTPKDMDFLEAKNGAAREIALAFGVPPMLLGIPGDNTYSNYREANLAFWRGTVLPLVGRTAEAIGAWLGPAFGEELRLSFDADQVDALGGEREALWSRVAGADFLTVNEKRAAVGYGPVEGGDAFKAAGAGLAGLERRYNPDWHLQPRVPVGNPDGGQWTDGGATGGESFDVAQGGGSGGLPVDLLEEEQRGGHTIAAHVGRSPESLLARVRGEHYWGLFRDVIRFRDGSFSSVAAATRLVNSTLSRNRAIVSAVASGQIPWAFVTATFRAKTGIEAYRPGPHASPYLRDTYGVGVYIVHDPSVDKGYAVISAYPRND